MNIKNIIFDYGGVILNIDPSLTFKALKESGIEDVETLHMKIIENDLYNKIETGAISPQEFREGIRSLIGSFVTDQQIDDAWNALILDMPPERIKLIEEAGKNYRVFMLSNTNQIHYDKYRADLENQYGYNTFSDLFEKAHFSHEIGFRKPHPEIYLHVLKSHGLKPEETVFIDDSIVNIKAADKLGLTAILLDDGVEVTDLFKDGILKL